MALSKMMQHYFTVKEQYKDAIIFYRLGDFYEMFFDDAIEVSKVLDITLTGRDCGLEERAPMCGIPYHSVDTYIAKLIKEGYKIAICEQLGDVADKTLHREVVRVITAGTVTEEYLLEQGRNNYILCVFQDGENIGISYADISTGEFQTTEFRQKASEGLNDLIVRISPAEIICNAQAKETLTELPAAKVMVLPRFDTYYDWAFDKKTAEENLQKQFGVGALKIYDLTTFNFAIIASGALLEYLNETQKKSLTHFKKIKKANASNSMILDAIARRNLELVETMREKKKKGSLLSVLDQTKTTMGARKIRTWLEEPLCDEKEINARLDCVEELARQIMLRDELATLLNKITDIERLTSKIGFETILPKECVKLRHSLELMPELKKLLKDVKSSKLKDIVESIDDFTDIVYLLENALKEDPAQTFKEGNVIAYNFSETLDEYRLKRDNSEEFISRMEQEERQCTGIDNLKIKYNRVYGYYIEIPRSLSSKVPITYHRKQTVANFDRYTNLELKDLEASIEKSTAEIIKLEQRIYHEIKIELTYYIESFQKLSQKISELDCLLSFAQVAVKNNYTRPSIGKKYSHIKIIEGRHPVVEAHTRNNSFIANDTYLNDTTDKLMILTGPNMAGKSTYMRQVAIITLMAHMGSFVPAKEAEICLTDRIFTRVGASDDLASGQSTFMVEMMEMSNIIQNATNKSLVILDEIGRGTSTFDGLSIAWAVVEYFSTTLNAKTLFATHYHELTELEGILEGVKNYKINVKEINNTIVFLRKIVRGGASRSFGIEVASLAGVPDNIIQRAKEISRNIEQYDFNNKLAKATSNNQKQQESERSYNDIINQLKTLEIERLSPLESFEILQDLIRRTKEK